MKKRSLEEVTRRLGTRSDCWLAHWSGINRSRVRRLRIAAGIPAHTTGYTEQLAGLRHLLGTVPDPTIADMVGCGTETVRKYRLGAGIKPYTRGNKQNE